MTVTTALATERSCVAPSKSTCALTDENRQTLVRSKDTQRVLWLPD